MPSHSIPSAVARTLISGLTAADVRLPLRLSDEDTGVALDADGRDVLVVDVNGERPAPQTIAIAAVNAFAGFSPVGAGVSR